MRTAASGGRWLAEIEDTLKQLENHWITLERAIEIFRRLGLNEADLMRYHRTFRAKARAP